ncbi:Rpn family recombination-promoting nuclease/putative transposase [Clostridium botulinum]|uniref:Rpn family recombination-promoting nuclease/putative transposase n=2 Tax=Clostridium botulinum TaxID=1491 RepID=UPI0013C95515|nr:Rpn family recombination-promoting nuclease/putative transposase [Clostridium botulinum]MBN1072538.1 Rpn family recombination-promoting nuclease/putative transposase [Clostridium botulinum]NFH81190.1 Rpn family recombination-promoting nuclease/putative transposase [Clostridium botulinum]NFH84248.1 Rpn family recombination-promoting nuclease/putative transposase [Clostridium botulinum]NFI12495.1 Rpn family recombination-promoting nuclease/putative transposase [Clostridium botulinum]NFI15378.
MKNNNVHHEHDVGYKHIFSHKETFLEFLRSFTKKEWANLIKEEDLILVDKSYILSDFEEEESDILYKANIDDKEVIFYVLLEFQSKVDFQMPMRLLFYMTEIWRDVLKNTEKNERKRKNFKLPSIVPIVLYNGKNKWSAKVNFKEILSGYELFEDNILDFNYMLFDINRYSDDELLNISNMISAVFLLDQEIDEQELMKRLKKIIYILKKVSPEQFSVFKKWLKNIVKPRVRDDLQGEINDVLEKSNQEEVDFMVSNLGKTIERMQDKAIEKGIEKGLEQGIEKKAKETAIKAINLGMSNEIIIELTGLTDEKINDIRKEISH